jgi:hypothetical protein
LAAEELAEPQRPDRVDLDRAWQERSTQFRTGDQVTVLVRLNPARRKDLVGTALAVRAEEADADGWLRLEVTFQDSRHAEWALWQLATSAEALASQWWLRTACATAPVRSPPATECHPESCRLLRATGLDGLRADGHREVLDTTRRDAILVDRWPGGTPAAEGAAGWGG